MTPKFFLFLAIFILLTACAPVAAEIVPTQTAVPAPSATPIPPTATPDLRVGGFIVLDGKIYAAADDGTLTEQEIPGKMRVAKLSLEDDTLLALDESGAEAARYENGVWVEAIKGLSPEELAKLSLDQQKALVPEIPNMTVSGIIADQIGVYRDGAGVVVGYYDLVNNVELGLDDERLNEVKVEIVGTGFEGGSSLALIETIKESEDITEEIINDQSISVFGGLRKDPVTDYNLGKGEIQAKLYEFRALKLSKKELQRVLLDDGCKVLDKEITEFNRIKLTFVYSNKSGVRSILDVVIHGLARFRDEGEKSSYDMTLDDFYSEKLDLRSALRMTFPISTSEGLNDDDWANNMKIINKNDEYEAMVIGSSTATISIAELEKMIDDNNLQPGQFPLAIFDLDE